jgi:ribosomal protein S18 acetylase RimI-like enzyme
LAGNEEAPWGFFCIQVEDRPTTLPLDAPTRAYVRGIALLHGHSPTQSLQLFIETLCQQLGRRKEAYQLICYGHQQWFIKPLLDAGFAVVERVQFFQLNRLDRRPELQPAVTEAARLVPADLGQLGELARLDAETFAPLWHFSEKELLELLLRCRVQVALVNEKIVGYAALATHSPAQAQLARLAVHPSLQGRGIGRQLLADSIGHARSAGFNSLTLNTQASNQRSQKLYSDFGFRPVGRAIPTLAKSICPLFAQFSPQR